MQLPESLKIGGHTYRVVLTDDDEKLDGGAGVIDDEAGEILIDSRSMRSVQEASLFHEIFHALNATMGETTIGHSLLCSLAEQFYTVLADNNLLLPGPHE